MIKILIVDDEIDICDCMKKFLSLKGHGVDIAINGIEAVDKIRQNRPHVIFLDVFMPGMNGFDVLKEIKKIDSSIKVIIVTAVRNEQLFKEAFKIGASEFICKPIDFKFLEDVLTAKIKDIETS